MVLAMKGYPVLCNNVIATTDNVVVVLQNCVDLQKDEPGLHSEASPSSSEDGDQAVNIKVEDSSDIEDRENPMPMTVVGIKAEHEVSCMSLCPLLGISRSQLGFPAPFVMCICHAKLFQSGE
jgi:hypothetical protein